MEWKLLFVNCLDLLEKNAMSALSFSSVQYRSGVKLNDDTSMFVVAIWSFVTGLLGHMIHNLDCNWTISGHSWTLTHIAQ